MFIKESKDYLMKILFGTDVVPTGLSEMNKYFRFNEPIIFDFTREGEETIAISRNFRYGKIITSAKKINQLDDNIKDAILTAFEIPSSYKKEAGIKRVEEKKDCYAFA